MLVERNMASKKSTLQFVINGTVETSVQISNNVFETQSTGVMLLQIALIYLNRLEDLAEETLLLTTMTQRVE